MESTRGGCLPPLANADVNCKAASLERAGMGSTRIFSSQLSDSQRRTGGRCRTPVEETKHSRRINEDAVRPRGVGDDDEVMNDLHAKLAHIQWRKHANGKSIRRAIDTSKRMRERDLLVQLAVDREGEREKWTEAIVRDELARPAQISEIFLKDWEQHEAKDRRRQLKETKLHLSSLKKVERAVKSKGIVSTTGVSNVASEGRAEDSPANTTTTVVVDEQESDAALEERLRGLKSGIRQKRRELRRAARKADPRGCGGFSATSFKTGRGRW